MIYKFRMWLATNLFRLGKIVHPEISELVKEILKQQEEIGNMELFLTKEVNHDRKI